MRARVGALVFVAAVVGGGLPAASAHADTADLAVTYQINVAHSGVQTDGSLIPPLSHRWTAAFPSSNAVSYPVIADGKVFVTASEYPNYGTHLYALDQADGHVLWSQAIPGTYDFSAAAYDAGRVFVVNFNGLLRAFDAGTGAELWATQLRGQSAFTSPPTAANGVVYVGGAGSAGTVYAIDETTGALLAAKFVENGDHSSPTLSDTSVFVAYACNQAYGFSQSSLAFLWHYSTFCEGGGGKTTVYANGRVYTRDYFGNLILDAATGNLLGSFAAQGVNAFAPAVDQTSIFTLAESTLTAKSLADSSVRWTFTGDGQLDMTPIVLSTPGGEFVVVASASGMLYALDATTGTQVWSVNVGTEITQPDEWDAVVLTGLGAGQGLLVVPAGNTVSAYGADTTPPTVTVPPTITVRTQSSNGAAVSYSVTANDPDDTATVSCAPSSSSTFPVGTTTVSCTATDTVGNTASASFLVVVNLDTTAPTITVPATITPRATSTSGTVVSYSATASDPDDAATVSCSLSSGSTFPVGTTTVSCTAADTVGNTTNASFLIVVSAPGADCRLSDYPSVKGALNLKNANLSGCYLPAANLSGANATNANLGGTYLAGANLSSATLAQAQLQRSVLSNANLSAAKLNFAVLTGANLAGATLIGVNWSQTTCPDGTNSNNDGGTCIGHLG